MNFRTGGFFASMLSVLAVSGCINNPPLASDTRPVDVMRITTPDFGGDYFARVHHIKTLEAAGTRVEINNGICLSACTFYLSMEDSCTEPDVVFGFHAALHPISLITNPLLPIRLTGEDGQWYRARMIEMFDGQPEVQERVREATKSGYFTFYTGAELIEMGIEEC